MSSSEDPKFDELMRSQNLEKEYPMINSPYFAQKLLGEIKRASKDSSWTTYVLQNKYTYWVLFLGLVLFPAWADANSHHFVKMWV